MSRYNIPRDFKKDNTEVKFFTKKSLIYTIIGSSIGFIFLLLLERSGHLLLGVFSVTTITIPFYVFGRFKYDPEELYNGGLDLDVVVYRKIKKKLMQRIYVTKDTDYR